MQFLLVSLLSLDDFCWGFQAELRLQIAQSRSYGLHTLGPKVGTIHRLGPMKPT